MCEKPGCSVVLLDKRVHVNLLLYFDEPKPLAPMRGASSPHSKVMVGKTPTILHGIHFPVPSLLGLTGALVHMMALVLSHMMEINWSHDGN